MAFATHFTIEQMRKILYYIIVYCNTVGDSVKFKKYILPTLAIILVIIIFSVSLLKDLKKDFTATDFAMGSPVNVTVYGEYDGDEISEDTVYKIKELDREYLSHTLSTSLVYRLNTEKTVIADEWFIDYLNTCMDLSAKNDGFTLFSGEMKDLWDIQGDGYVPNSDEIENLLSSLENSSIKIDNEKVTLNNGKLDLGALGKGTACEEAIKYLKGRNAENAIVTVGGTVGVIGKPDGGKNFSIGVRDPFGDQSDYFAVLNITDCFVSTSGDYEKYFERDGVRYSHIFDAKTAMPVQSDISSVTVVVENGTLSDYLSTVIFIAGVEKGFEIAKENNAQIIIVKKDKSVLISEELEDKLTICDNSFLVSVME